MNPNPLQNLKIKFWYQVIMVSGITVFIINGLGLFTVYPPDIVAFISLAFFFLGLGEWINHPLQQRIMPSDFFGYIVKTSGYPRRSTFIGVVFDVISVILFIIGGVRIIIKLW